MPPVEVPSQLVAAAVGGDRRALEELLRLIAARLQRAKAFDGSQQAGSRSRARITSPAGGASAACVVTASTGIATPAFMSRRHRMPSAPP